MYNSPASILNDTEIIFFANIWPYSAEIVLVIVFVNMWFVYVYLFLCCVCVLVRLHVGVSMCMCCLFVCLSFIVFVFACWILARIYLCLTANITLNISRPMAGNKRIRNQKDATADNRPKHCFSKKYMNKN